MFISVQLLACIDLIIWIVFDIFHMIRKGFLLGSLIVGIIFTFLHNLSLILYVLIANVHLNSECKSIDDEKVCGGGGVINLIFCSCFMLIVVGA